MWENAYLSIKNPKASRALKQALDPGHKLLTSLVRLCFTTSANFGLSTWGPSLDQILDPHLHVVDTLKELKMQYNSISNITNYTFLHFSALETRDLQNCKISSISPMGLNGLTALKALALSGNAISSLHTNVFGGLVAVNSINLDKNSLTDLPSFNSSTLKTLSVEQNKLVTTGNGSFVGEFVLKT